MSRHRPRQSRRRPEPNRRHGDPPGPRAGPPRARGFTPPGWDAFFRVVLPYRGARKRRFFNDTSDKVVVVAGALAALVGYGAAGVIGSVAGLAIGLASSARVMKEGRFFRG